MDWQGKYRGFSPISGRKRLHRRENTGGRQKRGGGTGRAGTRFQAHFLPQVRAAFAGSRPSRLTRSHRTTG
jgi:hypothetical protein